MMEVNEGSSRGPPPPAIRRHQPRPPTVERNPSSSSATSTTPAGSAAPPPRPPPHLRIRVLNLQQRHRDLCVQLDATTNLPSYRRSHYPPFTRTLRELAQFALSLSVHVPTHILAALPLPTPGLIAATSIDGPTIGSSAPPPVHPTSLPEGRLFCYHLSRWLSRLVAEPAHRDHAETRNFVEAEYSYHPIEPMEDHGGGLPMVAKRWHALMAAQAASDRAAQAAGAGAGMTIDVGVGFGLPSGVVGTTVGGPSTSTNGSSGGSGFLGSLLGGSKSSNGSSSSSTGTGGKGLSLSRNVHDDDEDLVSARMEVTRLELQFGTAATKGQAVVSARSQRLATATAALCNALHTWSGLESTRPLCAAAGLPKHLETLARGLSGPLEGVSRASCQTEGLTMLYQLAYQGKNAKAAKEALLARNALVEEQYEASKRALVKKREVEHLKVKMGSQAAQHHHGGGSNSALITRDRIEVAIEDFTESARYAGHLRELLADLSGKMHDSLRAHSRCAHADVKQALQEYARGSVGGLKREMSELRRLRGVLRGEVVEDEGKRREGAAVMEGEEEGEEESVAAMGRSEEVASPPDRTSPTSPSSSSAAVPAGPIRYAEQDGKSGSPAPSAAMSPSPSSERLQQHQQHLQQQQHLQRPYGTPTATPPRTLSPSPYTSPPTTQQQRQLPAATATQSMFLPRPQRGFEDDDEAENGRRAFAAQDGGGLNTSRFGGGSSFTSGGPSMMSNSVSALPTSPSAGRDSPAVTAGDDPFASTSTSTPPSTAFGTMPRSGAGFGTMRGGAGGARGGRGGGRISAAEAARSLAGRF